MEAHGGEIGPAAVSEFEGELEAEGPVARLVGLLLLLLGKRTALARRCWSDGLRGRFFLGG
jgi:hypothetical protein